MRRGSLFAWLIVLATLTPGCLQGLDADTLERWVYDPPPPVNPPPEPIVETVWMTFVDSEHQEFRITASDGIELVGDVWIPSVNQTRYNRLLEELGAMNDTSVKHEASGFNASLVENVTKKFLEGPFPVVLMLSPYFEGAKRAEANNMLVGFYGQVLGEFLPRGYAVAAVDLRGTRASDGCLDLGGPQEQQDAHDIVEWLGTQNWSNGRVGMIGVSYDGWTQQQAAVMQPDHLAAIVPVAPVADWYHVVGKGGGKFAGWTPGSPFGYNFQIGWPLPPGDPAVVQDTESTWWMRADDQQCAFENQAWSNDPTGDANPWMQARDLRERARDAEAPMFYVHGFADVNARPDHIDPWYANYGGPKKAFLWQMDHAAPTPGNTGRDGVWWNQVIRWFDHHLYDLPNGVNETYSTVEVQDSLGRWRLETTWPPEDVNLTEFRLAPGALVADGDAPDAVPNAHTVLGPSPIGAEQERWHDDPSQDGGGLGTVETRFGKGSTDARLAYRSNSLDEDLHYAGRPVVRAYVDTDRANTLVVARLYEVLEDGSWVLINRGVADLRHRDGLANPQPVTPGEVYEIEVAMQPQDHVFRAGRALGLTLTSSDASYVVPTGEGATNTIHYDDARPSALLLPEIERDDFFMTTWGPGQPPWLGPLAWEVDA